MALTEMELIWSACQVLLSGLVRLKNCHITVQMNIHNSALAYSAEVPASSPTKEWCSPLPSGITWALTSSSMPAGWLLIGEGTLGLEDWDVGPLD